MPPSTQGSAAHGLHVAEVDPKDIDEPITWRPAAKAEGRRRVVRWTCECRTTVYYLVSAGGHGYLERTRRGSPAMQTDRLTHSEVARLWERLLMGQAL
ncbi:hypothetical protein Sru01_64990 [Sphaerisporangium rufum]|uniref:Uncharacterized protein n=1 Tax=Sphaerisporangium rufum TaxID=1381558 RepID=A0A919RCK4_9ACTN|nr:hypothetical protein [Sphaerisporangium rufum]GII81517.1 hypothetical protein Sru01_64990 [Sphaerisporangium rufum]